MQTDQRRHYQPSLPSISTIFKGISIAEKKPSPIGHGDHDFEFKQMEPAAPVEPNINEDRIHHNEITTTADMGNVTKLSSTGPSFISQYTHPTSLLHYHRGGLSPQRSPRNLHARSFSDYTHPYPNFSPPHHSSSRLAPIHNQQQQNSNNTFHRRAISSTTFDLKLQPIFKQPSLEGNHSLPSLYASSSTTTTSAHSAPQSPSSVTTQQDYFEDTHSYHQQPKIKSPISHQQQQHSNSSLPVTASTTPSPFKKIEPKPLTDYDGLANVTTTKDGTRNTYEFDLSSRKKKDKNVNLNSTNNKYKCPYCTKGFSRPSSVRIHIYSHTGERPFKCPHNGCFRKFSVQSNMRRHMKIHTFSAVDNDNHHHHYKTTDNDTHRTKQQQDSY